MANYKDTLKEFFGDECLFNEPMNTHTTYRTGGPAEVYLYPQTPEQWAFVLKLSKTENIPLRVVGFGSNILVSAKGIGGITCSTKKMNRIVVDANRITAQAGAPLDKVCELACKAGLAGMEKLSGIPGSVGGAVFMNAGAYGQETADCLEYFDIIDWEGRPATLLKEDVQFAYRHVDGLPPCIILSAGFMLKPGNYTQLLGNFLLPAVCSNAQ